MILNKNLYRTKSIYYGLWSNMKYITIRLATVLFKKVPSTNLIGNKKVIFDGRPELTIDDNSNSLCTACDICVDVCPSNCISITKKSDDTLDEFYIDLLSCIYCGLCEEYCPEKAIEMSSSPARSGAYFSEWIVSKEGLLRHGNSTE